MLSSCSLRAKLSTAFVLLALLVLILAGMTLYSTYSFRDFVKYLSQRSKELPVAAELSHRVSSLRMTVSELQGIRANRFPGNGPSANAWGIEDDFNTNLDLVQDKLFEYQELLGRPQDESSSLAGHNEFEMETVAAIEQRLAEIRRRVGNDNWTNNDVTIYEIDLLLGDLQRLTEQLPGALHEQISGLAIDIRSRYHMLNWLTLLAGLAAGILFTVFVWLCYRWVFQPLQVLIDGSRHVASGRFSYRIHLDTKDEMAELATAFNDMIERFETIRNDLDSQVRERTKQVVRSEQLASVGFLAAGVAHEINNPLASIAMCAESMEGRLREFLMAREEEDGLPPSVSAGVVGVESDVPPTESDVMLRYLSMIQDEAFRCKGITEKLLDFSRIGQAKRMRTDLAELVQGVVDMVGHLGKYQDRRIEFVPPGPVFADVNAQEIKQIVLNLLTNALDSLGEAGGWVRVECRRQADQTYIVFTDNGCGMSDELRNKIFEPFFTQRQKGQGTGLGLSITHRIVEDHGGRIDVRSDGPGKGSVFTVLLPASSESRSSKNGNAQANDDSREGRTGYAA